MRASRGPSYPQAISLVEAQFLDPTLGDYVDATVQLAADEIFVFDRSSKPKARWRYSDIRHAHSKQADQDFVLMSANDSDSRLVIHNPLLYSALQSRVPGLRLRRARAVWRIWNGLPDQAQIGIILTAIIAIIAAAEHGWKNVSDLLD
jgi:hypothetical protein